MFKKIILGATKFGRSTKNLGDTAPKSLSVDWIRACQNRKIVALTRIFNEFIKI